MATVGQACLLIALGLCGYGAVASVYGARTGHDAFVLSGRRSLYAVAMLVTAAFVILEIAFLRSDFSYTVVASHSSTTTPWYYRGAAMWSSQQGSLLLWLFLLSVWSSVAMLLLRGRLRDVAPYATAVLLGLGAFFAGLLVLTAQPFTTVAVAPAEGVGLNPLLRHPSMMIHPVMLYSGYTLFSIPFAFAIGALIVRRVDAEWIRATRFFSLAAWLCLGFGIILGARWSYSELGWGGYWAWDPGRERVAAAVADRHRVPALRDDPGETRDAEGLERVARARDGHPRDPRHVPRALGDPRFDPCVRGGGEHDRLGVHLADRGARHRIGLPRGLAPQRRAAQRGAARLDAVPRGGVPGQQRRLRRRRVRRLLGHVLPADLRGGDRARSLRSARRGSTATRCRSC